MQRASAQMRSEARAPRTPMEPHLERIRERDRNRISIGDTMPGLPMGGLSHPSKEESASQCVGYQDDPANERPPTPSEIKKYRKSWQQQPGLRLIHVGVSQDKPPHEAHHRHGIRTVAGDRVTDCMDQVPSSELREYHMEQKEALYRSHIREPLGKGYSRGHVFPEQAQDPNFAFGQPSSSSESAKNLLYFAEPLPDKRVRSRLAQEAPFKTVEREVTRQLDRNYKWQEAGVDPRTHRFGKVWNPLHNGVAKSLNMEHNDTTIASKRQQQIRGAVHDRLGKAREIRGSLRNLGEQFVFGRITHPDEWGVKKSILGEYSIEEQMPDKDLGISTRKLSKLSQVPKDEVDRSYGVPSIRHDLETPQLRSVADPNNYGDESNCKGLLYPSRFAVDGVDEQDFVAVRSADEIRDIFARMGAEFEDGQFERLCDMACRDFGGLSADSFRHAWNKSRLEQTAALSPLHQQASMAATF